MINAELMNSGEKRKVQELMKEQYGTVIEGVMHKGSNERIYLGTQYSSLINHKLVNAEGIGVYIGRMEPDGFRPSIEGAQLLRATKNTFEISEEQAWEWIRGFKISIDTKYQGYCIITNKGDILGAGKIVKGNVWNYTPKERRIKNLKTQSPGRELDPRSFALSADGLHD